jgi:hypothetical protein
LFDLKLKTDEEDDVQKFEEPKQIINLNNLMSYEMKKDMRLEILESKKGVFSNKKKTLIRTNSNEDLEDWVHIFDRLLKK